MPTDLEQLKKTVFNYGGRRTGRTYACCHQIPDIIASKKFNRIVWSIPNSNFSNYLIPMLRSVLQEYDLKLETKDGKHKCCGIEIKFITYDRHILRELEGYSTFVVESEIPFPNLSWIEQRFKELEKEPKWETKFVDWKVDVSKV